MANNTTNCPQSCVMILLVCIRINTRDLLYFEIFVHLFEDGLDYLVDTDFQNRYLNSVIEIDIFIWLMSVFEQHVVLIIDLFNLKNIILIFMTICDGI